DVFLFIIELLTLGEHKVINSINEIDGIGHRVLHGKEKYTRSTLIDDDVIKDLESFVELGPLHIPPQVATIKACRTIFGKTIPQVAVFDTAFHQTMPPKAYIFPIPLEYYTKYSIRRYGFHGSSHSYVLGQYFAAKKQGAIGSRIITCHLGNGSSITAVKDGRSIDTSMGFTPLDGFIMGTRSGSVDPSILPFLQEKENLSPDEISEILNKKSGFLGISGISSDLRDIEKAAQQENVRAQLTLEILVSSIKKYIGQYAAVMNGLDAIIFTGGIGENSDVVRHAVCSDMEYLGLYIDDTLCKAISGKQGVFSAVNSKVEAWVIPTNEELLIANETFQIVDLLNDPTLAAADGDATASPYYRKAVIDEAPHKGEVPRHCGGERAESRLSDPYLN
ncbi:MAG: acetate kinase, partial [Oscillospiraceae bacterium]